MKNYLPSIAATLALAVAISLFPFHRGSGEIAVSSLKTSSVAAQTELPACANGVDDDNDGLIDFPNDVGCENFADLDETDPKACNDGVDNDGDSKTDYPYDLGCNSFNDNTEENPACSDEIDNDSDGYIDFPDDIGCSSFIDDDELNPQCSDGLDNDGDKNFDYPLDSGCDSLFDNDETSPQCSDGMDNDGDGLIDFREDKKGCFDEKDNDESDPVFDRALHGVAAEPLSDSQYPLSIREGDSNDLNVKIREGDTVKLIGLKPTVLASNANEALKNGEVYYSLLEGTDENGKGYIVLTPSRYWDPGTLSNANLTKEPLFSYFRDNNGSLNACIDGLSDFPSPTSLIEDPFSFQYLLELLTICQSPF